MIRERVISPWWDLSKVFYAARKLDKSVVNEKKILKELNEFVFI